MTCLCSLSQSLRVCINSDLDTSVPPLYDSAGLEQLAGQDKLIKPDIYAILGIQGYSLHTDKT